MKIIVVMPVRNEEWILEKTLKAASLFADHIIVADQGSTDKTPEICRKFNKVEIINNKDEELHQSRARQLLLDKAREYGKHNIILALDADEVLTANCLTDEKFRSIINSLEVGQSVLLEWIMVWRNPNKYRKDNSVWSNNWKHFIFRDDGMSNFSDKPTSEPRMPENFCKNYVKYNNIKVLHYQFIDWERMLAKQRRYRVCEYIKKPGIINAIKINTMYYCTKDERGLKLVDVPKEWLNGWKQQGITFDFPSARDFYWYDEEILKVLNQYGHSYFKWLDIWDIDWEKKRQLALKKGIADLPEHPIKDPRPVYIKFYHNHLQQYFSYNNFLYRVYQILKRF